MQYIFFGWLLVFLHFRINGFDLLPDFIGYGLIFAGCRQLSSLSHYFNKTKVIAAFMCLFHFSELLQLKTITIENEFFMIFIVMFDIALMLVPLLMMYLITKGISTIEEDRQCYLGSDTLMRILKIELFFYVLLFVGTAGVLYSSMAYSKVLLFDLTIATVCILILNLVWVACFYSCKKRFEQVDEKQNIAMNENEGQ